MISCSTAVNYVEQTRSINVTWMLNSTRPANLLSNKRNYRVLNCAAYVKCGNGYVQWVNNNVHYYSDYYSDRYTACTYV